MLVLQEMSALAIDYLGQQEKMILGGDLFSYSDSTSESRIFPRIRKLY